MNWPLIVAEMFEALAAILRRYAPVTLDGPDEVQATVEEEHSRHVSAHPD